MRHRREKAVTLFVALLLGASPGCDKRSGDETRVVVAGAERSGRVVATVGDVAIRVDDVALAMKDDGSTASEALDKLIEQTLLFAAGARSGLAESPEASRAADRLIVRAFLGDLEKVNTPESVADEQVAAYYDEHRASYDQPERRKSYHVLVRAETDEAREVAAEALREMRRARDPLAVFEKYKGQPPSGLGFEVVAEELPAISMKDGFAQPFKEAVFAAKRTGVLREPVKTQFGWHAIYVADIQREKMDRIKEVEAEIRDRLTRSNRFDAVVEVVRKLNTPELVTRHKKTIDSWIADARHRQ